MPPVRRTVLADAKVSLRIYPTCTLTCTIDQCRNLCGGIAHWITTETAGTVRTNATDWTEAYQPYIDGVIKESEPYLVNHGGPIVAFQLGMY